MVGLASTLAQASLWVVDPADPAMPRLVEAAAGASFFDRLGIVLSGSTPALEVGNGGATATVLGRALLHFVRGGQLYEVDLRRSATTAARPISSLTTACLALDGVPLDAGGTDAWVPVQEAGPDGDCATADDNREVFVRSGSDTTVAPVSLALQAFTALQPLPDATGRALWLLGVTPSGSRLFDPSDLSDGPAIANAGAQGLSTLAPDPGAAQTLFVSTGLAAGATLHRLSYGSTGAALGPVLHTFAGATGPAVVDAPAVWLPDGRRLLRLVGGAAPDTWATLPAASGEIESLTQTDTHLVVTQGLTTGSQTEISVVPKAGGSPVSVATADPASDLLAVEGAGARRFVTSRRPVATIGEATTTLTVVEGDGTAPSVVAGSVSIVAPLRSRTATWGRQDLDGMIFCTPAAGQVDCRGGTVQQFDLDGGRTTTLGTWSYAAANTSFAVVAGTGHSGLALALRVDSGSTAAPVSDFWLLRPGVAGSLVRVAGSGT